MDNNKDCQYSGCNKSAKTRGYCKKHYTRVYRTGLFKEDIERKKNMVCSVDGCKKEYYGSGYCQMHYQRNKRHGSPYYEKVEFHGMINTTEYKTWESMKERCSNSNLTCYKNYGGRGITVCDRWLNSFMAFYADMGKKPIGKHGIDRIDNDGNYEPRNCRWATVTENNRNKRSNKCSMKIARDIRNKRECGMSVASLSKEYMMSLANIKDIINNKIWKEK